MSAQLASRSESGGLLKLPSFKLTLQHRFFSSAPLPGQGKLGEGVVVGRASPKPSPYAHTLN